MGQTRKDYEAQLEEFVIERPQPRKKWSWELIIAATEHYLDICTHGSETGKTDVEYTILDTVLGAIYGASLDQWMERVTHLKRQELSSISDATIEDVLRSCPRPLPYPTWATITPATEHYLDMYLNGKDSEVLDAHMALINRTLSEVYGDDILVWLVDLQFLREEEPQA